MICNSPASKVVGLVTWAITGLASLNVGLARLGFDLFGMLNLAGNPLVDYIVGGSGLVSVLMFVQHLLNGGKCD